MSIICLLYTASPLLNKLIVDSLKAAGYVNLIHTENGQKAYDVITQCKEDGKLDQHVRWISTDIEMPEMDGHRLTKLVKSDDATKDIPCLLYTSRCWLPAPGRKDPMELYSSLILGFDIACTG